MLDPIISFMERNPQSILLLMIILGTLILMVLVHEFIKIAFKLVKKKPRGLKRIIGLEHPLLVIIVLIGLQAIISTYLRDYHRIQTNLNNVLISFSIIIASYMLMVIGAVILENWSKKIKKTRNDETHEGIVPLLKSVVNICLGLIGVIAILQVWNVAVGALLTSIGIAGVVLGFAFKDTLTNVFGGISLILDDTFRKGDLIELTDGEIGFVLETSLRSTKLKNFDGEEIYVPNSVLANMKVKNYAQPTSAIRIKIRMPIKLGENIQKVEKLVLNMLNKREDILKYPEPKFYILQIKDHYVDTASAFFINDFHDLFVMKSTMTKEIYNLFLKNNIEIPYPTRRIYQEKKLRGKKEW